MTETTREIFKRFEIRKSKKQKSAFIEWLTPVAQKAGYDIKIEKGGFGARNIVIGDPETAKVIFTAHYDTCAALPFPNFITPKNILIFILFQFAIAAVFVALAAGLSALLALTGMIEVFFLVPLALLAVCVLMLVGPANKHTANDNTSGVTAVIDTMNALPENLRRHAAFLLFDLEEAGLIGSSDFYSKHKKTMKNKPLINFDCVSDGGNMLFVVKRKARNLIPALQSAYGGDNQYGISVEIVWKGAIYPSDQANFPLGVGVAALNRSKKFGVLYMDKIHTKRDTVYQSGNVRFLAERSVKLVEALGVE